QRQLRARSRWSERCPRSRTGQSRPRDGNRYGRRDGSWRHHPFERRSARHSPGSSSQPVNYAEHPPKSVLRVHLQRDWSTARGRSALSRIWPPAEPDDRGGGHELQLRVGDCELAEAAHDKTLVHTGPLWVLNAIGGLVSTSCPKEKAALAPA